MIVLFRFFALIYGALFAGLAAMDRATLTRWQMFLLVAGAYVCAGIVAWIRSSSHDGQGRL